MKIFFKTYLGIFLCLVISVGLSSCKKQPEHNPLTLDDYKSSDIQNKATEEEPEENVIVSIGNFGRTSLFVPYKEKDLFLKVNYSTKKILKRTEGFDYDLPPSVMDPEGNPEMQELLKAKVSGILYDDINPSAIINIMKEDHLVHIGDSIFDFYIEDITKQKVTIRCGFNSYKAGIGEVVEGKVVENNVFDLENKFAGGREIPEENFDVDINIDEDIINVEENIPAVEAPKEITKNTEPINENKNNLEKEKVDNENKSSKN